MQYQCNTTFLIQKMINVVLCLLFYTTFTLEQNTTQVATSSQFDIFLTSSCRTCEIVFESFTMSLFYENLYTPSVTSNLHNTSELVNTETTTGIESLTYSTPYIYIYSTPSITSSIFKTNQTSEIIEINKPFSMSVHYSTFIETFIPSILYSQINSTTSITSSESSFSPNMFSESIAQIDESSSINTLNKQISTIFQVFDIYSSQIIETVTSSENLISIPFKSTGTSFTLQSSSPSLYSSTTFIESLTQINKLSPLNTLSKQISTSSSQAIEILTSSETLITSISDNQIYSTPSIASSIFKTRESSIISIAFSPGAYSSKIFSESITQVYGSSSLKTLNEQISCKILSSISKPQSSMILSSVSTSSKTVPLKESPKLASWIIVLIVALVFLSALVIAILIKKNYKKVQKRFDLFRPSRHVYPITSDVKDIEMSQCGTHNVFLNGSSLTNAECNDSSKLNDILTTTKYDSKTEADEKEDEKVANEKEDEMNVMKQKLIE